MQRLIIIGLCPWRKAAVLWYLLNLFTNFITLKIYIPNYQDQERKNIQIHKHMLKIVVNKVLILVNINFEYKICAQED